VRPPVFSLLGVFGLLENQERAPAVPLISFSWLANLFLGLLLRSRHPGFVLQSWISSVWSLCALLTSRSIFATLISTATDSDRQRPSFFRYFAGKDFSFVLTASFWSQSFCPAHHGVEFSCAIWSQAGQGSDS
jgi:hypothetical protein